MADNFSSIGFKTKSEEGFNTMISEVLQSEHIGLSETPMGSYLRWVQDMEFGPEIFFQYINEEIVSLIPFFRGKSEMTVGMTEIIPVPGATPLDALVHGWAEPQDPNDMESGLYPFVFNMVALHIHGDEIAFPSLERIGVCAITQEIEIYADQAAFDAANEAKEMPMASESFIPSGLFVDDDMSVPTPQAIINGQVLETRKITNEKTGTEFYWALVQTLGGTVDAVIDPEFVLSTIEAGNIISGSFYLCADFK